jgi:hypothetical protein
MDLVGKFFLTWANDTTVENQGVIYAKYRDDQYRVHLFSFLTGEPTDKEVWSGDYLREMATLYADHQAMAKAYYESLKT